MRYSLIAFRRPAFLAALLLAAVFVGCEPGVDKDGVSQELDKHCEGLTQSGTALVTYVWYDGEIAKAWYDDINTVNDSLVAVRKKEGGELLHALSNSR